MKNRKITFCLLTLGLCSVLPGADSNRSLNTQIADLLARMPASTPERFASLMEELLSMDDGMFEITKLLRPAGGQDSNVRYALNGLAAYAGKDASHRQKASVLFMQALKWHKDEEIRAFLLEQLDWVAGEEAVQALRPFLKNRRLAEPAARILVRVGGSHAQKVLLRSLGRAPLESQPALIQALGEMRCTRTQPIEKRTKRNETASSAWWALANIGEVRCYTLMTQTLPRQDRFSENEKGSWLMLYARRLNEKGDSRFREVAEIASNLPGGNFRCDAFTLYLEASEDPVRLVLDALSGEDDLLAAHAARLSGKFKDPESIRHLTAALNDLPEDRKILLFPVLGESGDDEAVDAVRTGLKSPFPTVQQAAVVSLPAGKDLQSLAGILPSAPVPLLPALGSALSRYSASELSSLVRLLPLLPAENKAMVYRLLGEKGVAEAREAMFADAALQDSILRRAALQGLWGVVCAEDLGRLLQLWDGSSEDSEALSRALIASGSFWPDREAASGLVLERWDSASDSRKRCLLSVLAGIGGVRAQEKTVEAARSEGGEVRRAAVEFLAGWPDYKATEVFEELMGIPELEELAAVGIVRAVAREEDEGIRLRLLLAAMDKGTVSSKRHVLNGLSNLRTKESLEVLDRFLDHPELGGAAARAAVELACPRYGSDPGLTDSGIIPTLVRTLDVLEDEYMAKQLENHIAALKKMHPGEGWTSPGAVSLFHGDLAGWMRHENLPGHGIAGKWFVEDEAIVGIQDPPGQGGFLVTKRSFKDFELSLEAKIDWPFDSGIFLRVGPDGKSHQITLDACPGGEIGAVYCPWTLGFVFHNPEGISSYKKEDWNRLRIRIQGEPAHILVWLNDTLITDFQHTIETTAGIPEQGGIALQVHPGGAGFETSKARFRRIAVKELYRDEEWIRLFNGQDFTGWTGATDSYLVKDGKIVCPEDGGGNLYTAEEFDDFILRFEFLLTPGANNGLGIRAPMEGDAAYVGMELQILDDTAEIYKNLMPYQYHGSVYGVVPSKRGHLNPVGEWNFQEVEARGSRIIVRLNGETIVDADIEEAADPGPMDGKDHPGLIRSSGRIGFLGHGSHVEFRNIYIKRLQSE